MGTKRVAYMSSDDKTDFTIGANLILEIQKSYAKFFTYEYMNSDTESYSTNIVFYTFAWGMELELNVVNLTKFDDSNLEQVLDSTNGLKVVVINNRDILSDELKEKYPVMGVYFDFDTQAAIDKKTVIRARVDTVQYYRLSKNYLPTDVAYLSDIPEPGGDAVEVDATLSIEGAAADAKATGDAIISLGDNTVGKTYYSIDMETLKNNGVLVAATNISSNGLTIAISLLPCIFENGVEYKIIDMPFKYMYFNGAVLTNRNSFTNVGIQSPVITQQLGIDRVLWIDTLYKIMCNFPDVNESGNFSFGDDSQAYHPEAVIKIEFNVCGSSTPLNQLRGLWEAIFATPGTKIVFEYQNQENIETVEAEYLYGTTPAPISL